MVIEKRKDHRLSLEISEISKLRESRESGKRERGQAVGEIRGASREHSQGKALFEGRD